MVAQFLLNAQLDSWEVIVGKLVTTLIVAGISYLFYYSKKAVKENEKALLAVSLLDVRVQELVRELDESLKEKMADGQLTKDEIKELKKEAIEATKRQAKILGMDALEKFAPKLFPTIVDSVMENLLKNAIKK